MQQIISFNSLKDFLLFLRRKECYLLPGGEGSEGQCYLSKLDGKLYKFINKVDNNGEPVVKYDITKIITTQDIDLIHYVLPEELYVINNQLIGYKTKYIKEDNFFTEIPSKKISIKVYNLTEKKLLSAYYRILKETDRLSKKSIQTYDLNCNILFTGEDYFGIDTCGYQHTENDVFSENKYALEEAIKENLSQILYNFNFLSMKSADELMEECDMEIYTRKLVKLIKKN